MQVSKKFRQSILDEQARRGLVSVMNNTKWKALATALKTELPFPPAYQRKDILIDAPEPEEFEEDVWWHGDWTEGILPFVSIEWVRIRPLYLKHRAKLLNPEIIDEEEDLLKVLTKLRIPFKRGSDSIWIYGYTSNTSQLDQTQ